MAIPVRAYSKLYIQGYLPLALLSGTGLAKLKTGPAQQRKIPACGSARNGLDATCHRSAFLTFKSVNFPIPAPRQLPSACVFYRRVGDVPLIFSIPFRDLSVLLAKLLPLPGPFGLEMAIVLKTVANFFGGPQTEWSTGQQCCKISPFDPGGGCKKR
jgi:hypothetical protein